MDWLRRYVFHNIALKLLSLGSAFLLWTAVAREPAAEIAHTVPIEFLHVPDDVVISSRSTPEAQVWIRGPQRLVRGVGPAELHVTVDLSRLQNSAGEHVFDLAPSFIKAPTGIEVIEVVPAQVRLRLDPRHPTPLAP